MSNTISRHTSRVEIRKGRPVIVFGGEPVSQAMYCDPRLTPGASQPMVQPGPWLERNRDFFNSGVHNFHIIPVRLPDGLDAGRFWTADGVYPDCSPDDDIFCVDKEAAALIEMDPQVKLIVRFGDRLPQSWYEANPDHIATSSTGEEPPHRRCTMASTKALEDLCTYYRRLIAYCEAQPWAERVYGYWMYPDGEGTTMLANSGFLFDHSPLMQEAFRRWVRHHYGGVAELQEAWGDPRITFETVRVPTEDEWREAKAGLSHWIEGDQLRRERDYLALQRELYMNWFKTIIRTFREALSKRPVIFGLDIGKTPMMGWQIQLSFSGIRPGAEFINNLYASGNIDLGELLDEPGLDLLCTPADYTARTVGYGFESEGLSDSLLLRGKVMYCENDCRTFAKGQEDDTQGAFRSRAEVRAGMLRNAAWSLSRGQMDYWMIAGGQYFHDPEVQEHGVRLVRPLLDAAPHWPHRETEHAIAMIIDDTSPLYEDGTSGYQCLSVIWQRVLGLYNCGIPYRIYLFSDLEKPNMPDYRCYLFPNLFKLDEERLDLLRRKVLRDGRMAIFGPATGITDGRTLSAEWASRLLGVEMELVRTEPVRHVIIGGTDPIVAALPASLKYGDSMPYGPLLIPARGALERPDIVTLGMATTFWQQNRPGLFLREASDEDGRSYRLAWSVAVPLPANLLRELARRGDCHVWCEEDDVVLASETLAALHSVKPGPRVLKLPSRRTVWDLLSRESLGEMDRVEMQIAPPETRLFYFGEESPYGTS